MQNEKCDPPVTFYHVGKYPHAVHRALEAVGGLIIRIAVRSLKPIVMYDISVSLPTVDSIEVYQRVYQCESTNTWRQEQQSKHPRVIKFGDMS